MANQTLRELAKEHAQGTLDKDSYRKSRANLIQGIISASIPLKEIDYPPLVEPPEPESLDDTQRRDDYKKPPVKKAEPQAAASPEPRTGNSSTDTVESGTGATNKILFAGLALAIVAIIIVAVLALRGGDNGDKSATSASAASATAAGADSAAGSDTVVETTTKARGLILSFLDKKNWSDSSLNYFLQEWAELPADDMLATKGSLAMGQLTNAIYKQLLEEQALSGLVDDDSSLNKQRQLVQFATGLGIEDSRISLPEELEEMDGTMEEVMEEMEP